MTKNNDKFCLTLDQVKPEPLLRAKTGIDTLDWMYGYTLAPNGGYNWGIPCGKISSWYGQRGIGKSRAAIAFARALTNKGYRVLYILTEGTVNDFSQWAPNFAHPENLLVGNYDQLEDIVKCIRRSAPVSNPPYVNIPYIIFIDSVNEIDEFINGNKKEARFIMNGDECTGGLKDVVNDIQCHIILLNQLNENGTAKGGTSLPHLIDIEFEICRMTAGDRKTFVLRVGSKHRYGRTGPEFFSLWKHEEKGASPITDYQLDDPIWCKTHNIPIRNLKSDSHHNVKGIGLFDKISNFFR